MRMREFIRQNRKRIDKEIDWMSRINLEGPYEASPRRNDEERKKWILNDEGLYQWAQREGVPI